MKTWKTGVVLAAGLSASALVQAIPISATQDGASVTILHSISQQTVSFKYIFEVDPATDNGWAGTYMDAFSIQFGDLGNNGTIIDSLSAASMSATVNGAWTGYQDKVSGNGCSAGSADAVCFTMPPSGTAVLGGLSETIIAAGTRYWFRFDVVFKTGVDVADVLAGEHSIKFLSLKYNCGNTNNLNSCHWTTGNLFSQNGLFYPDTPPDTPPDDPPDNPVPLPGTLGLLGLGLVNLAWRRARALPAAGRKMLRLPL